MDTKMLLYIAIAVVIVIVVAALIVMRKRRSDQLKQRFGPEYDRAVLQHGDARHAEAQ